MNTNHGMRVTKHGYYVADKMTKVKQPRKQRDYNGNIQLELCHQCPLQLSYYDKLVKYWERTGGLSNEHAGEL